MPAAKKIRPAASRASPIARATPPLVSHCTELLECAGPVRHRRMFGGWGFYVDDLFVALMIEDRLYLKVNAQTQARFQAAGGEPFVYDSQAQQVQLNYYTPPADVMDAPALMQPWVALAVQAALAARAARAAKTPPARTCPPAPAKKAGRAAASNKNKAR